MTASCWSGGAGKGGGTEQLMRTQALIFPDVLKGIETHAGGIEKENSHLDLSRFPPEGGADSLTYIQG